MGDSIIQADGSTWRILAGDRQAASIVSRFTEVMQLRHIDEHARHLIVLSGGHSAATTISHGLFERETLYPENNAPVTCVLSPIEDKTPFPQFLQLSLVLCVHAQTHGGVLIHGALAERDGDGVILAGPGGVGKTTASQRLMPPWHSLCDDLTLVVRDRQGIYWAHPWPTWSRFMPGGPGGSWDVQYAVPLRGIFFLTQSTEERVEPIGAGQATCLLVESAEQALFNMPYSASKNMLQALRLQRFENICSLVRIVPCFVLHLSVTGAFWQHIEQVTAC